MRSLKRGTGKKKITGGKTMITPKMQDAINGQINAEIYSAYLYLGISAVFEDMSLKGFAHWMRIQFDEEMMHAMKLFDYVLERDGKIELEQIDKPELDIDSPLKAFEVTLEHEQKVTGLINSLVDVAIEVNDHASQNFLQWFVGEQVEEEANANEVLQQLRLLGDNPAALFMVDRDLGARPTATPPDAEAAA
jgi:ferritin